MLNARRSVGSIVASFTSVDANNDNTSLNRSWITVCIVKEEWLSGDVVFVFVVVVVVYSPLASFSCAMANGRRKADRRLSWQGQTHQAH